MSAAAAGRGAAAAAPRRVAHVLWSAGIGGIERLVLDLAPIQRADPALAPAVLFLASEAGDFGEAFRCSGIPLHSLGLTSGRDLSPAALVRAVRAVRQFDVVHMHVFNPLLALATVLARRPVIYTVHGVLAHGRPMRLSDRINDRLLRHFLNRQAKLVTFNSAATRELAKRRYGLERVAGKVIYNGIALPAPQSAGDGAAASAGLDAAIGERIAGRFVVGTASRFSAFKRLDRLIDGFAAFARTHSDAVLLLVGDGALRPALEARVAERGIAAQTIFAGFRSNVRAWKQAMSVCVFPSAAEPFGLVALEALSIGKPAVVFADGGGMVEVVAPCCPDDVVADTPALAARLEFYAANRGAIDAGVNARREFARRFDIHDTAAGFRRHYLEIGRCAA